MRPQIHSFERLTGPIYSSHIELNCLDIGGYLNPLGVRVKDGLALFGSRVVMGLRRLSDRRTEFPGLCKPISNGQYSLCCRGVIENVEEFGRLNIGHRHMGVDRFVLSFLSSDDVTYIGIAVDCRAIHDFKRWVRGIGNGCGMRSWDLLRATGEQERDEEEAPHNAIREPPEGDSPVFR